MDHFFGLYHKQAHWKHENRFPPYFWIIVFKLLFYLGVWLFFFHMMPTTVHESGFLGSGSVI